MGAMWMGMVGQADSEAARRVGMRGGAERPSLRPTLVHHMSAIIQLGESTL